MSRRFWALGVLTCLLCLTISSGRAGGETTTAVVPPPTAGRYPSIRSGALDLVRLVEVGTARSASFRALVDRLKDSDVIVYVRCRPPRSNSPRYNGKLSFVAQAGARRLLAIELHCPTPENLQLSFLAHELHHAVEIADAPDIRDEASMLDHYSRIGFPSFIDSRQQRAFETEAARQAGEAVRREIRD